MRAFLFLFFSKMATKHLNSKWPPTFQFKMTDRQLFIIGLTLLGPSYPSPTSIQVS